MFAEVISPFAAFLLIIASFFDILQGASAVAGDELYAQAKQYLYELDLTAWGWIHIAIGLVGLVVAVGVLLGTSWGRVAGMTVAVVAILTNFAFLPVYPAWSAFIIAFNVLVVWALYVQLDLPPRPDLRPDPIGPLQDHGDNR